MEVAFHKITMSLPMAYKSPLHNRRNMLLPKAIGYFKMNAAKQINQAVGAIHELPLQK